MNVLRHIFYDRFVRGYSWLYSTVPVLSWKLINISHSILFFFIATHFRLDCKNRLSTLDSQLPTFFPLFNDITYF